MRGYDNSAVSIIYLRFRRRINSRDRLLHNKWASILDENYSKNSSKFSLIRCILPHIAIPKFGSLHERLHSRLTKEEKLYNGRNIVEYKYVDSTWLKERKKRKTRGFAVRIFANFTMIDNWIVPINIMSLGMSNKCVNIYHSNSREKIMNKIQFHAHESSYFDRWCLKLSRILSNTTNSKSNV